MKQLELLTPNPKRLIQPLRATQVEEHRYLNCAQYARCLEDIAHKRWQSWSCKECVWYKTPENRRLSWM